MNFADKTFVSFSNMSSAATGFSQDALKSAAAASYGLARSDIEGIASLSIDTLKAAPFDGVALTEITRDGYSIRRGAPENRQEARADILLRGAVTAGAKFPRARLGIAAEARPIFTGIDADIPNPAPVDSEALEAARRAVLVGRLQAIANDNDAVTDSVLEDWLSQMGCETVTALIARGEEGAAPLLQYVLSFSPVAGAASAQSVTFPVTLALMIRDHTDPGFSLRALFHDTRNVQSRLELEGAAPRQDDSLPRSGRAVVAWIVDETWFDDGDWPGGDEGSAAARKAARILAATDWLAAQSIVLVPISV